MHFYSVLRHGWLPAGLGSDALVHEQTHEELKRSLLSPEPSLLSPVTASPEQLRPWLSFHRVLPLVRLRGTEAEENLHFPRPGPTLEVSGLTLSTFNEVHSPPNLQSSG